MRVMLTANVDVDRRFANGTQGRINSWAPRRAADAVPKQTVAPAGEDLLSYATRKARVREAMTADK